MSNEAVQIPIQLDVTGINVSKANAKDIQKELTSQMSGIKKAMKGILDGVDTSSFSDKLRKSFEDLKASYNDLLVARDKYSSRLGQVSKDDSAENIKKATEAAKQLETVWSKFQRDYSDYTTKASVEANLTEEYRARLEVINRLVAELKLYKSMSDTAREEGASEKMWNGIETNVKATTNAVRELLADTRELVKTGQAFKLGASEDAMATESARMRSLNGIISSTTQGANYNVSQSGFMAPDDMIKAKTELKELETELEVLKRTFAELNQMDVPYDKYFEMQNTIQQLESEVEATRDALYGLNEASATVDDSGVVELAGTVEDMASSSGTTKDQLESLINVLSELAVSIKEVKDNMDNMSDSGSQQKLDTLQEAPKNADKEFKTLKSTLSAVRLGLSSIGTTGSSMIGQVVSIVSLLTEAFSDAGSAAQSIIPAIGIFLSLGMKVFTTIINLVKTLISYLRRLALAIVNIAKQIGGVLWSGVQRVAGAVSGLFSNIHSHQFDLKNGKRMLMQYIFGFRSAYFLIRRLRQTIIDGMKDIAAQSEPVNKVMSEFKTQLNELKGRLVSAFQPVISVVLPILTAFMRVLSQVMTVVAKFFAVLTGQGYYYDYTAYMVDYADAISGVGKAAKEAKKDLMGFDEINRLSAPNEPSGGGAGKEGEFTPSPIDTLDAVSKFAEMVRKAWEAGGEFTEVGNYVGNNLNDLLDTFNKKLLPKVDKFGNKLVKSLATFINGLVEVEGLGTNIGTTISNVLNTLVGWVDTFLTTVHWDSVGRFIGDAINGAFLNFNWSRLFTTIATFFNSMFTLISTTAQTIEWWKIGVEITSGIRDGLNEFDAAKFGKSVHDVVSGFFDLFIGFIDTMDLKDESGRTGWELLGDKISEFFQNLDTEELGYKLGYIVSGLITGLVDVIKNSDFGDAVKAFADGFSDGMGTHDWKGALKDLWDNYLYPKLKEFWEWLKPKLKKLFEVVINFIVTEIVPMIASAIGNAIKNNLARSVAEFMVRMKSGENPLFALWDATSPLDWFETFGISLPSIDLGGIFTGAEEVASTLGSVYSKASEFEVDLRSLFDGASSIVEDPFAGTVEFFGKVFGDSYSNVETAFGKSKLGEHFSEVWETTKKSFNEGEPDKWFANGFEEAEKGMEKPFMDVHLWAQGVWAMITGVFGQIPLWFKNTFQEAWDNVKEVFADDSDLVSNMEMTVAGSLNTEVNRLIAALNTAIIGPLTKLNLAFDQLRKWNFLGSTPFQNLPNVSVPKLAEGAVLPPNNPFLAMVGDQKSGTNVEAPLDTIKQAVAEVMNENLEGMMAGFEAVVQAIQNKDMSVKIGDRDIGQANDRYANRRANMVGG